MLLHTSVAQASVEDDAMVTFCLAAPQRPDLRDAAEALGVGDRAATTDLPSWRKANPDGFERACEALYHSRKAPATSAWTGVLPFLTGLAGAVFAFIAAAWRDQVARGRELGDRLRTAATEFHEVAETYLLGVKVGKPDTEVIAARRKLSNQLAAVRAGRPRWTLTDVLSARLDTGDLGPAMTKGWDFDVEKSRTRVGQLRAAMDEMRSQALTIAEELASPVGRRRAVKSAAS